MTRPPSPPSLSLRALVPAFALVLLALGPGTLFAETESPDAESSDAASPDAEGSDAASPDAESPDAERVEVDDEIVVTATRTERRLLEVPANVSLASMDQLERDGFYVGGDELRGEPGIYFRRGEGDNDEFLLVNIRGVIGNVGNDVFLALVDGMPFVGPDEEVLMNDIPYAAVDDVEIVRGPVSALYGRGGIAGAVSYSLRAPDGPSTELSLAAGSDGYRQGRFDLARAFGDQRVLVSVDGLGADGWRENNSRDQWNAFVRGLFQVGDSTSISAWVNALDRQYDTGSVIPTFEDGTLVDVAGGREAFYGSRETGQDRRSTMGAARLTRVLGSDLSFELAANVRTSDSESNLDFYDFFGFDPSRDVLTVNGFDSEVETDSYFVEGQVTWASESATTIVGVNHEVSELDQVDRWTGQFGFTFECDFAFFAIEIDYRTGAVLNRDHPCFVDRLPRLLATSENTFSSAFAQTEWSISERVTLTLGGRYDDFERVTDLVTGTPLVEQERVDIDADHFSPKVALAVDLGRGHLLYANYGEGFSSNFGPVWQWDPSRYLRDARPTTLESRELGVKGRFAGRRGEYVVSLFDLDQVDRLVFVSNPDAATDSTAPPTIATSGQRYHSEGIEISLTGRFGDSTRARLDYSHVEAEWEELILDTFSGPLDLSGTRPTGVPENVARLTLDQRVGDRLDLRLSWEWYDDYAITQDNAFEGGGYDLLNLGASYLLDRGPLDRVDLSVTNLLDEEYSYLFGGARTFVTSAVPGVPLQARVTLGLRF